MTVTTAGTSSLKTCEYCGSFAVHTVQRCPRVASIEYDDEGKIAKITFHPPAPLPQPAPYVPPYVPYIPPGDAWPWPQPPYKVWCNGLAAAPAPAGATYCVFTV